jgi:cytochrome bd-type quinol oxidase subunit 2
MLLILTFIAGIALFVSMKLFSGSNGRIPSASTELGKRARIVVGFILVCYLVLLVLNVAGAPNSHAVASWIVALALGASVPLFRYVQFKDKRKKK